MTGTHTDESLTGASARDLGRRSTGALDELLVTDTVIDGRYRIEALLGEGGMGAVYSAEHVKVGRRVAFKVLGAQWTSVGNVARRFRDEARAASAAGHPNIIEVFDAGELPDGRPYLVMELLEGRELAAVIAAQGGLDPLRACRIVRDVARALDAAHARGVIHRDLKGENVMLVGRAGEEIVKVLDFGIAANSAAMGPRATTPGLIMGTPAYMAPEQAKGHPPTIAFDIYALGVLLHDALTGRVPFEEVSGIAMIAAKTSEPAPSVATLRDDLPSALVELVDSCLALDPTMRPATAREIVDRLTEIIEHPGMMVEQRSGPTEVMPPRRSLRRSADGVVGSTGVSASTGAIQALRPALADAPGSTEVAAPVAREPARTRLVVPVLVLIVVLASLGTSWWLLRSNPQPVAVIESAEASPSHEAPKPSTAPAKAPEPAPLPADAAPPPADAPPTEPPPAKGDPADEPTKGEPARLPTVSPDGPPAANTALCSRTRKQAQQAREGYDWDGVLRYTRNASCWSDQREDRQWLRAKAFSELGQWDECIKASRGLDRSEARKLQDRCRLRKEQG